MGTMKFALWSLYLSLVFPRQRHRGGKKAANSQALVLEFTNKGSCTADSYAGDFMRYFI